MSTKKFRIAFRSTRPIGQIEDWLSKNCEGDWDVRLIDIADDLRYKALSVYFQIEEDARRFRQVLPAKTSQRKHETGRWVPSRQAVTYPPVNYT